MTAVRVDPARCLHSRIRQISGAWHECLECRLRGELTSWIPPPTHDQTGSKRCSCCQLSKDRSDFYRNASKPDGLQGICRACKRLCQTGLTADQIRKVTDTQATGKGS